MTITAKKSRLHYTHTNLVNATQAVSVHLIGAGGNGSRMLTTLAQINAALRSLGHPGLSLTLWDNDRVSEANLARQSFATAELGLNKAVALINRTNRFFGTDWKAQPRYFNRPNVEALPTDERSANIYISCVDTAKARFSIEKVIQQSQQGRSRDVSRGYYWMDMGNTRKAGQVFLSTLGSHTQPDSQKYEAVDNLPLFTQEYRDVIAASDANDNTPSCSLREALLKQDLFINMTLAAMASQLLWSLFTEGRTAYRGFFVKLAEYRTVPVSV